MRTRDPETSDPIDFTPTLLASICGLEGAGKTDMALTFPQPIEVFSCDPNTPELVHRQQKDGADIVLHEYALPGVVFNSRTDVQDQAYEVWNDFLDDLGPIVTGKAKHKPSSIVLDTATIFYWLQLLSDHGKLKEIPQFSRAKSNSDWMAFLRALKGSGCHVALCHRLRNKYENNEKVEGEYEREGCSKTGFEVNVEVHLTHDPKRGGELEDQFGMTIVRCTPRPAYIGKQKWGLKRSGDRWASFAGLAGLVYPDQEW